MSKLIYATDIDRTVIFSTAFLEEHPTESKYEIIEQNSDGSVISYINSDVKKRLRKLSEDDRVKLVFVTSRSKEEYDRINWGFQPDYVVYDNGGAIIKDGLFDTGWKDFVASGMRYAEAMEIKMDVEDCISVRGDIKFVDNLFLMFKARYVDSCADEMGYLSEIYVKWKFIMSGKKGYIIPNHFSKAAALKYIWEKEGGLYVIASGDSELDFEMLMMANEAYIPDHGTLITEGYIEDGRIVKGGMESCLETIKAVEKRIKESKEVL